MNLLDRIEQARRITRADATRREYWKVWDALSSTDRQRWNELGLPQEILCLPKESIIAYARGCGIAIAI